MKYVGNLQRDMSGQNVGTSWTLWESSLGFDADYAQLVNTGGQMQLGFGVTGGEQAGPVIFADADYIQEVPTLFSKGMRVYLRSLTGTTISSGILAVNFYKS